MELYEIFFEKKKPSVFCRSRPLFMSYILLFVSLSCTFTNICFELDLLNM